MVIVDNPYTATLSLSLGCPSQLPYATNKGQSLSYFIKKRLKQAFAYRIFGRGDLRGTDITYDLWLN